MVTSKKDKPKRQIIQSITEREGKKICVKKDTQKGKKQAGEVEREKNKHR